MSDAGERAVLSRFPRPTALEWTALVVSLVLTLQYAWFLDDAFIYYRYVDNLVHLGRGLVFNEGEYVEGYSSPLWCLLMIPLRAAGLDWWLLTRLVGLACATGTWALLVVLARRMTPSGTRVLNLPLVYLAANYAVQTYFTSGVEAPLVQVSAVAFALFIVTPGSRVAQVLVGLAPMVRHELAAPLVIALAFAWWSTKRVPWTPIAVCVVTLGGWLAFRVVYYADLLPNTFYLKDEWQFARGITYLRDTFGTYGTYVLLPLFTVLAIALRGAARHGRERLAMLACSAVVIVYVAKIGGDPRHYRYLAFPFVLLACSATGLAEFALARFAPGLGNAARQTLGIGVCVASFALYPAQLSKHPVDRSAQHVKLEEINDAQYHRLKPDLGFSPWTLDERAELLSAADIEFLFDIDEGAPLPTRPLAMRALYASFLASGDTQSKHEIATDGWCVRIWKRFAEPIVQHDGLCDPILARARVPSWKAAHKEPLHALAQDLLEVRKQFGSNAGCYRRAVEAGVAKPWIARNIETIDLCARKAFNTHAVVENLKLAFTRVPRFDPGADASPPGKH